MTNILLIDDDLPTNMLHQFVLKRIDIPKDIRVAQTGVEALNLLEQRVFVPDLIFLDINMPAMNGFEFVEALREKQMDIPPVVLLTTSHNPLDQERADSYEEIRLYKNKPLSIEMVQDIFQEVFS